MSDFDIFSSESITDRFEQFVYENLQNYAPFVRCADLISDFEKNHSQPLNSAELSKVRKKWTNLKQKLRNAGILDEFDKSTKKWHINIKKTAELHLELEFRVFFKEHWADHLYYRPKNIIWAFCKTYDLEEAIYQPKLIPKCRILTRRLKQTGLIDNFATNTYQVQEKLL